MIRYVNTGTQIYDTEGMGWFSFYDTIIDRFLIFNGSDAWETLDDFMHDYNSEMPRYNSHYSLERFVHLASHEHALAGDE